MYLCNESTELSMKLLRPIFKTVLIVLFIIVSIVFFRAFDSRNLPKLQAWHLVKPLPELLLNSEFSNFKDFVDADKKYVKECFNLIESTSFDNFERYNPNSPNYPYISEIGYNSSFILDPGTNAKGIIVLLHGLSDSPYHIRDIAKHFYSNGYYVFGLRLPGHGTLPSGLLDVKWQDWQTATAWAMKTAKKMSVEKGDLPIYMGGFSTGGSLCINYSLNAVENHELSMPNKVFLFSPAAGVSDLAYVGGWHKSLSWMSYFKKFAWLDIIPEYDPAKYMSFTKNAGYQIFKLCKENMILAKKLNKNNKQNSLPAFISFESWVDATVKPKALVKLYKLIGNNKDKLILFNVNENFASFFKNDYQESIDDIALNDSLNFSLQIISNKSDSYINTGLIALYKIDNRGKKHEIIDTNRYYWPQNIYALSHISVPISPSNYLYGTKSKLSNMQIIGERNVVIIPSTDLTRLRYNPFFNLMMSQLDEFIKE